MLGALSRAEFYLEFCAQKLGSDEKTGGVCRHKSERLEERKQIWLRLPWFGLDRLEIGMFPESLQRIALHLQVGGESQCWHGRGSRELRSRRCPTAAALRRSCDEKMRRDAIARQGRPILGCCGGMLGQDVGHAVAGKGLTVTVDENMPLPLICHAV
nr:hypothetical protein [Mesorhizobium sp.]